MYKQLLIPLDGSKAAETVLPYARALASKLKVPVELMCVVDFAELSLSRPRDDDGGGDVLALLEHAEERSKHYLEEVAPTFAGTSVKRTVAKGKAEHVIIESAAEDKNTLIAMATHGRSGISRWLLGSVAEKVVRGSSNPLLLVRATESATTAGQAPLKTVIVPLDGSKLAESVLPTVVELAKTLNLEAVLIRAFNVPVNLYAGGSTERSSYEEIQKQLRALQKQFKNEASDYIEKKAEELKSSGVDHVTAFAPEGSAADQIIALAEKTPDSFIAMCTHGRSGVTRWVMGSVTENVVRHSEKPVLVVRAR